MAQVAVYVCSPRWPMLATAVTAGTLNDYRRGLRHFLEFLHRCCPSVSLSAEVVVFPSITAFDEALAAFVQHVVASRRSLSHARLAFYGVHLFNPGLARGLPQAYGLVRRLDVLQPPRSPPPFSWPLLNLVAAHLAVTHRPRMAVALLLGFDCYLRVGELVGLSSVDVVLGVRRDAAPTLLLRRTKTGRGRLQHVVVSRPAVGGLLRATVSVTPPGQPLFPFSAAQLRAAIAEVSSLWALCDFKCHSLRHGGATSDFATRSFEWILERGRWRSPNSARRYLQCALAQMHAVGAYYHQTQLGEQLAPLLPSALLRLLASQ